MKICIFPNIKQLMTFKRYSFIHLNTNPGFTAQSLYALLKVKTVKIKQTHSLNTAPATEDTDISFKFSHARLKDKLLPVRDLKKMFNLGAKNLHPELGSFMCVSGGLPTPLV